MTRRLAQIAASDFDDKEKRFRSLAKSEEKEPNIPASSALVAEIDVDFTNTPPSHEPVPFQA